MRRGICAAVAAAATLSGCAAGGGERMWAAMSSTTSPSTAPARTTASVGSAPAASTATAPPTTVATPAPPTVPPATAPPTGSAQTCASGQRLDDADGDTWGECVPDHRPLDVIAAQLAAEASGLPPGIPCAYPATIVAGASADIACAVVNLDASEGIWSFSVGYDAVIRVAPSYTQTKAPPPPPPTVPVRPLVGATTDPRFDTCKDAKAHGYGPYRSDEPEYSWYRDADGDGVVCE